MHTALYSSRKKTERENAVIITLTWATLIYTYKSFATVNGFVLGTIT